MSDLIIQPTTFDWTDSRQNLEMWIFSSIPWVDENAGEHGAGNEIDRIFTQRVASVTNNTTTHRLTVPSFALTPTVNAYVGRSVRLSFWIVQVIGSSVTPIKQVPGTEAGLQIPTALVGICPTGLTFADLIIYNSPSPTLPRDDYYPKSVVDAKLLTAAGVPLSRSIATTSPLTGGGVLSSNLTIGIPKATAVVSGYLAAADFAAFAAGGLPAGSSVSGVDLSLPGKLTLPSSGVVLDAGISNLSNILALTTQNPARIGLAHGTDASPINSDVPTLSLFRYDRTGGVGNGTTSPYFLGLRIKDGGTKLAYYTTLSYVESEDTNAVPRDAVGLVGLATAKAGSTSRPVGIYTESTIFNNAVGQGAYNEFKVVNSTGLDSPVPTSTLPAGYTFGLQITGGGGKLCTIGLGFGGGGTSAFRVGINFAGDVVASGGYGIDYANCTRGTPIRLGNNQPIVGYIGGVDRSLIKLNASGVVDIDTGAVGTVFGGLVTVPQFKVAGALNTPFVIDSTGGTHVLYQITSSGVSKGYIGFVNLNATGLGFFNASGSTANMMMTDGGHLLIGSTLDLGSKLNVVGLSVFANNAAATGGGLSAGAFYRSGGDPDVISVVH